MGTVSAPFTSSDVVLPHVNVGHRLSPCRRHLFACAYILFRHQVVSGSALRRYRLSLSCHRLFFSVLIVFVVAWSCCKWCTALSAAATVQGPKHAASLFWEEKKKRKHNCGTRLLMLLLLLWFLFEFNHRSTLWMKNSPPIQLKIHNSFNFWATAKKFHFIIISFLHVLTRREGCWWNNYF